jgi:hypothetical protein
VAELAKPRWGSESLPRYIYLGEVVPLTLNEKLRIKNGELFEDFQLLY